MNLSGILKIYDDLPAYEQFIEQLGQNGDPLGLNAAARPPLLARLFTACQRPILFVTGRVENVPIWQQSLESWLPNGNSILRFPEPTPLPYERGPWSELSRQNRLAVFSALMAGQHPLIPESGQPHLILTSMRALMQKTLPRRRFLAATRVIRVGQIVNLDKLINSWLDAGYEAVSVVESPGQFSRRGGIMDIYPVGASYPVRVELFGDEIETIRAFNPATQRSLDENNGPITRTLIPPAREVILADVPDLGQSLSESSLPKPNDLPDWHDDIPDLAAGRPTPNLEYYLPLAYAQPSSLLDYLPDEALVVVDDLGEARNRAEELSDKAAQLATEQPSLPLDFPSPLFEWEALWSRIDRKRVVVLGNGDDPDNPVRSPLAEAFQPGPRYGGQVRPFLMQLRLAQTEGERTIVVSRQIQRLAELWHQENKDSSFLGNGNMPIVESLDKLPPAGSITFVQGSLTGGFLVERQEDMSRNGSDFRDKVLLNLLTDAEIFGWNRPAPRRRSLARPTAPETFYSDIEPGDFVVHLEFGVGLFTGLVVRNIGGMEREYLQVQFANSDVLYVPVHHADRLSKWIGPEERRPELHRLGEKTWKRTKAKAQEAAAELAEELLELYAVRETIHGHSFAPDTQWQAEMEASFPYQETEDQLRTIAEVKTDMERPNPMDRLICGDVGYGKTEVALRAAFKAVMDNKQVAVLVPTTVLAQQHYNTFTQRLKAYPVNVEMLSRFRTASQQERIVRDLRAGQVDIIIGTHRLLSDDISFKDLGLLIIDEEQRFGVSHKETLKQMRKEVDVLTMTATPIPRTLYMSLTGVRDISQIDTAPADRLPVQTYVGEGEDFLLRRAILRELDRGGQIFYVHNRVQSINNVQMKLSKLVPEARFAIGHGQMSERELEDVMVRFVNQEIDVLVCTTIIESGLDIPNANTLIVDHADWFGLAQLYQLRGRVGRGARRAYAYFFHPTWRTLTADAKARLEAIGSQTELGAGYNIAMRDLEIRGAGDLLGTRQSGFIAAVGFDLYTRLLAQAVRARKAQKEGEQEDKKLLADLPEPVLIDLPLPAYVPTDYVPDGSLRLRLYRRMAVLETMQEIDGMAVELADRFGPIPDPVDNLLYQLRIKSLAMKAGILAVTTESGQIQIRLPEESSANRLHLQRYLGQKVRVSRKAIWLTRDMSTHEWQVVLVQVLEKLQSLRENDPFYSLTATNVSEKG
ncbi:MAG: transcription-repair coupling factor [Candidatus Promineifilaceae bacterium]